MKLSGQAVLAEVVDPCEPPFSFPLAGNSPGYELLLSCPDVSINQAEMSSMLQQWLLAAVHLLAFASAFAGVLARASALRRLSGGAAAPGQVLRADNVWGLMAAVLLITGLLRAFGGYGKGAEYYLHQPLFHLKMTLFVIILLLEVLPMLTLIRWRMALGRGVAPQIGRALVFARISDVQALLMMLMVIAASGMARGVTWAQL